jgi:hypothetical protein
MNKALRFAAAVLVLFVTSTTAAPTWAKDKVKILSVTPEAVVAGEDEIEFVLEVEYKLESKDEGKIYLGFNSKLPKGYHMLEDVIVKKGSGKVVLRAKVKPADWKGAASFYAYVNLSEHPHAREWSPLADTRKKIKITRR